MNLSFLLIGLWFFRTAASLSEATYYWQLKEYRWDRMKAYLFQQGGQHQFLNVFHLLFLISSLFYALAWGLSAPAFLFFQEWYAPWIGMLLLADSLQYFHRVIQRQLRRPRPTLRALMTLASIFALKFLLLSAWWFSGTLREEYFLAFVLSLLVVLEHDFLGIIVTVFNFFARYFKLRIFHRAQELRLSRPDLMVIGITGSFGKSSVKEYLSHILSGQFRVLRTEKNTNSDIGIAQTLLKHLKPEHEVFVCEMGAYQKGEIAICAQIARPKIGMFTGLNNQHVALFGGIDETFKAKSELIQSLSSDGLAVFNGDSEELMKRLLQIKPRKIVCSTSDGDAVAGEIEVGLDSSSFVYHGQRFEPPLPGRFQIINVLMSIVVAEYLGMDLKRIAEQVKTLQAPDKSLVLQKVSKGYLLDGSYNVNVDGLKQALLHLELFEGYRKVLFFPGILELGEDSPDLHEEYAEFISHHVDEAFFTDPNFSEFLIRGALRGGLNRKHISDLHDPEEIIAALEKLFQDHPSEQFVFLFESRGNDRVMQWLQK